ncbi:metallophosphoesterase family protein [Actinomadura parmotrematis]|uniref:Metallophosphatase family protein n=1 Tax=Actinomadura parmotrematis TaxID=2864039 RepID=A0ABS7G646_9ACTN|nr:metallophosphoesterase family protein [Actinomadura parmotrematis]MBW8487272.1 metallophosphatase family protein [Actinomadura parmotrematis]
MRLFGPAPWEGEPAVHGPVGRVAVLADVHANVPAFEAVLAEPDVRSADLVVLCGDLTWGPEPERAHELIAGLGGRALCVRGNADRCVTEIRAGGRPVATAREGWLPGLHSPRAAAFLESLPFSVVVDVAGLGPVRFCHGSPRSDHEAVTPGTPAERFAELAGSARVLVTGHTHLQFDRRVAGRRSVGPGSVGLPFHDGEPGTAHWALLGPDVELRASRYDVAEAIDRARASGDPAAERIAAMLLEPPEPAGIVEYAEARVFVD